LILAYQELEEENLDQKSPGPPGWGLIQQASPLVIEKIIKLLKKNLLEMLWIDATYDNIIYVRGLKFHSNLKKMKDTLPKDPCTFMTISR